jgi:hypothetical protein
LSILAADDAPEQYTVEIELLAEESEWWPAYLGSLGSLPDVPSQWLAERSVLVLRVRWENLVNVERDCIQAHMFRSPSASRSSRALGPFKWRFRLTPRP